MAKINMLLPALVLLVAGTQARAAAELPFETQTTVLSEIATLRAFEGRVEAVHHSTVAAQISDRIVELPFDVDSFVAKGSVIVRFRDARQVAGVRQAEAGLAEARARLAEARSEYQRVEQVHAKKLVAQAALDKARAALDAARSREQAAEAGLSEARELLERTRVRAPFDGIVTERHVEIGETPNVGQPVLTGLSLDNLRVVIDAPQSLLPMLREGCCKARVYKDAGDAFIEAAKLTVFPIADAASHAYRVRLDLPEGQHGLYPGMFVKVSLETGSRKALLIPAAAVVHRSEVSAVYVAGENGRVSLRHVRVGAPKAAGLVEVYAGLRAGERLALDPVRAGIHLRQRLAGGSK